MTLKVKFFLFTLLIHLVLGFLLFKVIKEPRILFLLAEMGILLSLFLSYQIYAAFIKPLSFISSGIDAIQDKDFNVKFLPSGSKDMNRLIGVYNKMIDNIRAERVFLEEQHYFLQKLIQASPNGIVILDHDNQVAEINPRARSILDLPANTHPTHWTKYKSPILQEITGIPVGTSRVVSIGGGNKVKIEVASFLHRGFKRKFVLIQELSKEILEAEKKAYSKVIRMMAHEVNNSIGAINSILSSTVEFYEEENGDPDIKEALQIAMDRNDKLNQFMKNFAKVVRLPAPKKHSVLLNDLIRNIAHLMAAQAEAQGVTIALEIVERPIWIMLDEQQIEQALVNITKNALEAIGQEGVIQFFLEDSGVLEIRDNGAGISKESADMMFSPFYSTKVNGQGIGLTLVKEILINHQAAFSLNTYESGWTVFQIRFNTKVESLVQTHPDRQFLH